METLLGERFKKIRKSLGMTQQEFADFLGINRGYISVIETDRVDRLSEQLLNLLELKTGFPKEWIRSGKETKGDHTRYKFTESYQHSVRADEVEVNFLSNPEDSVEREEIPRLEKLAPKSKMRFTLKPPAPRPPIINEEQGIDSSSIIKLMELSVHPSALVDEDDDIQARVESILAHYRETGDLTFLREVIVGLWKQKKNWKARALKAEEILNNIKSALKGKARE